MDFTAALTRRMLLLAPLGAPLSGGSAATLKHIDRAWFRKELASEARRWRERALRPNGLFAVAFDREWRPAGNPAATLVSQSRQIFVMTAGYELTRDAAYLEAVRKGADFLLEHYRDSEQGLLFYSVDSEGAPADQTKDSYGLAFAIFGLAHAARVTRNPLYREAALGVWEQMNARLREPSGLFRPKMDRTCTRTIGQNTQNPMMHLFEALLALHDATRSQEIFRAAQTHADLIFDRLYDQRAGRLPELYDTEWKPARPEERGYLELGHQFEWAFLLSHAVEKGFPKRYLTFAERLLDYGVRVGLDPEAGGIFSRADYEGRAVRAAKGFWEQCEALRTMMHWAAVRGRAGLWPAFDKSLAFARERLMDPEFGGWYYNYDPRPETARTTKGSIWQAGYHVCGLYREALRLAG